MEDTKDTRPTDGVGEVAQLGVVPGQIVTEHVPDHWAPMNRIGQPMRDALDWFRNTRVEVPRTLDEAFVDLTLALELYETCREAERAAHEAHAEHMDGEPDTRERAIGYLLDADEKSKVTAETRAAALEVTGGRSAGARTPAEKLVDLVPFVSLFNATARRLHRAKLDAEKETSVARRRHDTLKIIADRIPIVEKMTTTAEHDAAQLVSALESRRVPPSVEAGAMHGVGNRGGWKPAPIAGGGELLDGVPRPAEAVSVETFRTRPPDELRTASGELVTLDAPTGVQT